MSLAPPRRCSRVTPRGCPQPNDAMAKLTHLGKRGEARMVDVSAKAATERVAVAAGRVVMTRKTLDLVLKGDAKKGDVLGAARIAGIISSALLRLIQEPFALDDGVDELRVPGREFD